MLDRIHPIYRKNSGAWNRLSIFFFRPTPQVGHNRTNNFSDYLKFFLGNSDFLRLSKIIIILSSKKHGFYQKINVKTYNLRK